MASPPGGYGPPRGGYPPPPGYPGPYQGQQPGQQAPSTGHPPGHQAASLHKPITGSAETMALHAMTIDPKTGLPKGEKPPASPAAIMSLICGVLMCLPITGPAAIIAGLVARAQAQRKPHQVGGQGIAAIGIGLGVFNILLWTFAVIYYLSQDA